MPSFTAIAFDRLIEPGGPKLVDKSVPNSNPIPRPPVAPHKPKPIPNSNLERRHSIASRPHISPALYATPEPTPLPDSPTSFPPSPYIVNHKRRGPRLSKSFSQDDVALRKNVLDKEKVIGGAKIAEAEDVDSSKGDRSLSFSIGVEGVNNSVHDSPAKEKLADTVRDCSVEVGTFQNEGINDSNEELGTGSCTRQVVVPLNVGKDGESEDFFDPQESMSYTSNTDADENAGESSVQSAATPMGEFFDAWEELSSDSGRQSSLSLRDVDAELRGMRLSLLMEIEKRRQAEEGLDNLRSQWQCIRQQLSLAGLTLPDCPVDVTDVMEGDQLLNGTSTAELCQQVYVARFVSDAIGRGIAKAEVEKEMEAQVEAKNFEITRLLDRLHYYEAVNREMSQRNQEAVEMGRRNRHIRKRRQRWVWGSIAAAITLGTAALAWSYLPDRGSSSSTSNAQAPEHDDATK